MMTFRKLAASGAGKLLRAYFTEEAPQSEHDFRTQPGKEVDSGGRLTSYYTGRDSRAFWRPDMSENVAKALGINPFAIPKDEELDRLFEAKRADTGEEWPSSKKRAISAYDLTLAPHKSISLAAEFAATEAESAMIWHAIDRANDAAMRYVAQEIGWARRGKNGADGQDQGEVAWVSFRHHTARPTLAVQDGPDGATYLAQSPVGGDPHAHIHNALFNVVVTDDGRIGSLDTQRLHSRIHEFGAYFQAALADELRALGAKVGYDQDEQAAVLEAIPQEAVDLFSKGRRQVLRSAKEYAAGQGLDWETMSAEGKFKILANAGLAARLKKHGDKNDRKIWREQAEAIGWRHETILDRAEAKPLPDAERYDRAYDYAARHLAKEFETAAVIDHDRLRMYAARGLIGAGIAGGVDDIDRVVALTEERGIILRGEEVALQHGMQGEKLCVTNTAQLRIEKELGVLAKAAAADRSGALDTGAIKNAIDASGLDFERDAEHGKAQRAAIYALGQGSALTLLTGAAGAGKTALLKPLVAAWKADKRFSENGREVIGLATGWRQADALKEAKIDRTIAISPLLQSIEEGAFDANRNTVLVIDEIGQVAPRAMLALLELQKRTGLTIKGLGDREQTQAIEAGDAIEILHRALPATDQLALLGTIRQRRARERKIASLFRGNKNERSRIEDEIRPNGKIDETAGNRPDPHLQEVKEALALKRHDGTARFIGGDHDQVLDRIADFYMDRRDALLAAAATGGITMSVLTNEDAADLSRAVRTRMKKRGEIGADELVYQAVDQRGETYDIPIATGDRLRLFRRTWGQFGDKGGSIGNNGDIVEVAGRWENGLLLKDREGRVGQVEWRRLKDHKTGRLLVGFGHAMTVDAAQGITSDEHINALPRGTAGMTGFKAYVAESRARGKTWTLISDETTFDAVRKKQALGDLTPIKAEDMWDEVAKNMAAKPYKSLAIDLLRSQRKMREKMVRGLMRDGHRDETLQKRGVDVGKEFRYQLETARVRNDLPGLKASIAKAIAAAETTLLERSAHEARLRRQHAETVLAQREEQAMRSASSSPGM